MCAIADDAPDEEVAGAFRELGLVTKNDRTEFIASFARPVVAVATARGGESCVALAWSVAVMVSRSAHPRSSLYAFILLYDTIG